MNKNKLKKVFMVSDTTLDTLLAPLPINDWEKEARDTMDVRIIDPPIINGIDLREHPNPIQRERYKALLDSGGIVAAIFKNGKPAQLLLEQSPGVSAKSVKDFAPIIRKLVSNTVVNKVRVALEDQMESHTANPRRRGIRMRLKRMSSEDFWMLFTAAEVKEIRESDDVEVQAWVTEMDSSTNIKVSQPKVQKGLKMLKELRLLSKATVHSMIES